MKINSRQRRTQIQNLHLKLKKLQFTIQKFKINPNTPNLPKVLNPDLSPNGIDLDLSAKAFRGISLAKMLGD